MKTKSCAMTKTITVLFLAVLPAGSIFAADDKATLYPEGAIDKEALDKLLSDKASYSPYVDLGFPARPLFGDTHVHAAYSLDAGAAGARLEPVDALRFGKGEEVMASSRQRVKLSRPLEFMVVADHSDGSGLFPRLFAGDRELLADPTVKKWYDLMRAGKGAEVAYAIVNAQATGTIPKVFALEGFDSSQPGYRTAWHEVIEAAEEANEPGRFTAFIGFEWASNSSGDGNGNMSNGRMFPVIESFTGKKINRAYAEARARWEPLIEATQMKGDGEAHPFLSPNDEFADCETWDKGNLDLTEAKEPAMLEFEYARSALKNGLKLERELGLNPYKFGTIGSTDTHTALATADEDNFFGKASIHEPDATRVEHPYMENPKLGLKIVGWEQTASGYAAVWATENTREAIFDAMERRETYATTGPRMVVRFFGGWDFEEEDAHTRMPAKAGKLPAVGNSVDVKEATWTNTIGAPELIAVWKDPDFDPERPAFYFGRAIEIPTPRWTAYDAKYFGLQMPSEVPMTTQERAYTSPIWYAPWRT